jgi:hypothetical protein
MRLTLQEKLSNAFWWALASAVTAFLALGIVRTLAVILR